MTSLAAFTNRLPNFDFLVNKISDLETEEYYTRTSGTYTASSGKELKFDRIFWEDGGGNEGNLIVFPDLGQAVLYGYDHESSFNHYDNHYEEQKVFNGFPADLKEFLESSEFYWSWDSTHRTWATCGFWLDENGWNVSAEWADEVNWDYDEGGTQYTLNRFIQE